MNEDSALGRMMQQLRRALGAEAARPDDRAMQAAALPWRRAGKDRIEVLLITSRGTGRWVLPKGWIEAGESVAQAASREAWEEAGIEGALSAAALGSFVYDKCDGPRRQSCPVTVFALAVARQAKNWPERGQRSRAWMPAHEAARRVDEPELKAIIETFGADWKKLAA